MHFVQEFSIRELNKYLTKSEVLDLFQIVDASRHCVDEEDVDNLVLDLKKLVPFDCSIFTYDTATKGISYYHTIDYPLEYIDRYIENNYQQIDPVSTALKEVCRVVNWYDVDCIYANRPEIIISREAEEFGLVDGYTYGGSDGNNLAALWLGGKHIERSNRSKAVIEFAARSLICPLKAFAEKNNSINRQVNLSKKEIDVLSWLKEGKSTWDISKILQISERTVHFHVNNIVSKLDAMNRTHAVAIAIAERLIDA